MTTYTAQQRPENQTQSPIFLQEVHPLCKGKGCIQQVFQNSGVGGSTYQKPTYWAFLDFPVNSSSILGGPRKIPWDSAEEVSQSFGVNIYILSDDMDKGATCHHLWFSNRKKKIASITIILIKSTLKIFIWVANYKSFSFFATEFHDTLFSHTWIFIFTYFGHAHAGPWFPNQNGTHTPAVGAQSLTE